MENKKEEIKLQKGESLAKLAFYRFSKNKLALISIFIITFLIIVALFPQVFAPTHYAEEDFLSQYLSPSKDHIMGTDFMGRDYFSRIVYGARISVACCNRRRFDKFHHRYRLRVDIRICRGENR